MSNIKPQYRIDDELVSHDDQANIIGLLNLIHGWGVARNIIGGATPQAQFLKLVEEAGELQIAAEGWDYREAIDGLGDVIVVGTMMAGQIGHFPDYAESVLDACRTYSFRHGDAPYIYGEDVRDVNHELLVELSRLASVLARGNYDATATRLYTVVDAAVSAYIDQFGLRQPGEDRSSDGERHFDSAAELVIAALTQAWHEIKDRKGVVYKGVFIKSTDHVAYVNALHGLGRSDEADAEVEAELRIQRAEQGD